MAAGRELHLRSRMVGSMATSLEGGGRGEAKRLRDQARDKKKQPAEDRARSPSASEEHNLPVQVPVSIASAVDVEFTTPLPVVEHEVEEEEEEEPFSSVQEQEAGVPTLRQLRIQLENLPSALVGLGNMLGHIDSLGQEVVGDDTVASVSNENSSDKAYTGDEGHETDVEDSSDSSTDSMMADMQNGKVKKGKAKNGKGMNEAALDVAMQMGKEKQHSGIPTATELSKDDGSKAKRKIVSKEHVYKLVKDYQVHFASFSKGKGKKSIVQLIPGKVWKAIYADYKELYPDSPFGEITLKDHLRTSLKELQSGVGNPDGGQKAVLQDEDLMTKLVSTDSWKARNILQIRADACDGTTSKKARSTGPANTISLGLSTSPGESNVASPCPRTPSQQNQSEHKGKPPTKSENLKAAREDMAAIVGEFKSMKRDRKDEADAKRIQAEAKASFHEAKRHESETRRIAQAKQNVLAKISLLEKQKALGLITEDEFKYQCKVVFGILPGPGQP